MAESVISMRQYFKRNKILNIIRLGENVSRHEVKKETRYSMSTVSSLIAELIEDGLVYEEECLEVRVGRRPTWLYLNPEGAYFIGVEFNAQRLHCVMLNFLGEVVYSTREAVCVDDTADEIMGCIIEKVEGALAYLGDKGKRTAGLCIGVPGYIDSETGVASNYTYLKHWRNVPIRRIMEERFPFPCHIENNVNVMALAYKFLYFKGELKDFVFVSMRTGVRMIPILNNDLLLSKSGFSGELGHVHLSGGSRICPCGRFGCLNSEIANSSIVSIIQEGIKVGRYAELKEAVKGDLTKITIEEFCRSVKAGHEDSLALMKRSARILAEALAMVVNLLAPELIVLSGDITVIGPAFAHEVYLAMDDYTVRENYRNLEVCVSAFDKNIGAIGAATRVMQTEFEFIDKAI